MWYVKNSLRESQKPVAVRRVAVGLQERFCEPADERGREFGVIRLFCDLFDERTAVHLFRGEYAEPQRLVCFPERKPVAELVPAYAVLVADPVSGLMSFDVIRKDMEDKDGSIPGVRDDDIRQDGVSVPAAVTFDPHDTDFLPADTIILEIPDASPVIGVDMAFPACPAGRAGLLLGSEKGHVGLEPLFWRKFNKKELEKKCVFSYHSDGSGRLQPGRHFIWDIDPVRPVAVLPCDVRERTHFRRLGSFSFFVCNGGEL